jgi:hypothetical protein
MRNSSVVTGVAYDPVAFNNSSVHVSRISGNSSCKAFGSNTLPDKMCAPISLWTKEKESKQQKIHEYGWIDRISSSDRTRRLSRRIFFGSSPHLPLSIKHTDKSLSCCRQSCLRRIAVAKPAGPPPTINTSKGILSRFVDMPRCTATFGM